MLIIQTTINLQQDIDVIDSTRLLGTVIQKDLRWELHTAQVVRKANARMEILRRVSSFGAPIQDLKDIYILFIKKPTGAVSYCVAQFTNRRKCRRFGKGAKKCIKNHSKDQYKTYKHALAKLSLEKLSKWREKLCLTFAQKCTKNPRTANMFPMKKKKPLMQTRNTEKFEVQQALNERLKNSSIIYMQNLLNKN